MNPPPNRPARPEQRLLEAAVKLVAYEGIAGTNVEKIVAEAKTSSSQLHGFYSSKDDLLIAVFHEGWRIVESAINRKVIEAQGREAVDAIMAIVDGLIQAFEQDRESVSATLILATATVPGQPLRDRLKASEGFLAYHWFGRLMKTKLDGEGQSDAPEVLELALGALLRRFYLLTPLCCETAKKEYKPDFERFRRVYRRMIEGMLDANKS